MAERPDGPPNPILLRPEPLPTFNGEGGFSEAEDFVAEARRRLQDYHLAPGHARDFVINALRGLARREVLSSPADDRTTAADILELIQTVFGDSRRLTTVLNTFHSRRMGIAEGVLSFSHALAELAARANATTPGTIPDQLLRDHFIEGLTPKELRRDCKHLARSTPATTFLQAKAEALRWMREDATDAGDPTVSHLYARTPASLPAISEGNQAFQAAVFAELRSIREEMASRTSVPVPAAPTHPEPAQVSLARPSQPGKCWWCQQDGHQERHCEAKRLYRQRESERRKGYQTRSQFPEPSAPWYHPYPNQPHMPYPPFPGRSQYPPYPSHPACSFPPSNPQAMPHQRSGAPSHQGN
jgi:hypothetical protein